MILLRSCSFDSVPWYGTRGMTGWFSWKLGNDMQQSAIDGIWWQSLEIDCHGVASMRSSFTMRAAILEAKDKHVSDKLCIIGNVDSPVILMLTCISQTVYSQLTGIVDSALAAPTCSTSDMCSISQSRKRSLIS